MLATITESVWRADAILDALAQSRSTRLWRVERLGAGEVLRSPSYWIAASTPAKLEVPPFTARLDEFMAFNDERSRLAESRTTLRAFAVYTEQNERARLRRVACASCRRIWHLLSDERSRKAVELSERYADGTVTKQELSAAQSRAAAALKTWRDRELAMPERNAMAGSAAAWGQWLQAPKRTYAAKAAKAAASPTERTRKITKDLIQATSFAVSAESIGETLPVLRQILPGRLWMLKCIFGNLFRTIAVDPAWLTPAVVGLASFIYEESAFARLPDLASVLEARDCKNADILNYCRQPGEHVRGCWVVDLILGKE